MSHISCGIDFGTTNTSAAIAEEINQPCLVEVEGFSHSIPSAIFFSAESKQVHFGKDAMSRYMSAEQGRFMRSLKRVLGTNLMSVGTQVNDKMVSFENILGHFMQNIKNKIDAKSGQDVENVVLGRPIHFRDNDEKGDSQAQIELKNVAKSVGFKNIEFQFEPIAAAFAHEAKIKGERLACVVDIGGGTSDFSIIKIGEHLSKKTDRKEDVLASTGVRIGGNDFDKDLSIASFMPELGMKTTYGGQNKFEQELSVPTSQFFELSEWSSINSLYNYKTLNLVRKILLQSNDETKYGRLLEVLEQEKGHSLLSMVENAKISLTDMQKLSIVLDFLQDKPQMNISKETFEKSIFKNMAKVSKSVEECLKQANVKGEGINLVVLTGGSTEIPYVQHQLCSYFPNAQISAENKFSSVGLGLAYDSLRRFG